MIHSLPVERRDETGSERANSNRNTWKIALDLDKIERLENMSFDEQLRHFQSKQPWAGMSLPNKTTVNRGSVNSIDGNVTRMPPLGGKPCFGNPIAWLAHGLIETHRIKTQIVRTRCGRCLARGGCERIAEARLGFTPEIAAAAQAFRMAGGARAFHADIHLSDAAQALARLGRVLRAAGPFTSVNDDYARSWVASEKERKRANDARRQREKRVRDGRRELKDKRIPDELMEQIETERVWRAVQFRMFAKCSDAPKTVTLNPNGDSAQFTSDVWRAKTILSLQAEKRKRISPYAIAGQMIADDRAYGLGRNVLRDRVRRALTRIAVLEVHRLSAANQPVWPAFSPKEAFDWLANNPLRDLE